MKIFLNLFFLLLGFNVFCQNTSIKTEYELIYYDDDNLTKSGLSDYYNKAKNNAKYLTFFLEANANQMSFYSVELNIDEINTDFSLAFSDSNGIFYKEIKDNIIYKTFDDYALGKVTLKKDYNYKWNITNETKKISNFTCYKATSIYEYNNGVGNFNYEITAWFCPDLPYSYGPKGIGGLPGLILELHEKNYVFGLKKIIFIENEIFFEKKFGKVMTESEYSKGVNEFMENEK